MAQFFITLLILTLSLPLIGIVSFVLFLIDGPPVLFRQTRIGESGIPFEMLKLRTMTSEGCITGVGRLLRLFKVDELPQLVNVLRGDMNLIGPRPYILEEHNRFATEIPNFIKRYRVRPGITGLGQILDPKGENRELALKLDIYYVCNRSFLLNVAILCYTLLFFIYTPVMELYQLVRQRYVRRVIVMGGKDTT